MLGALPRILFIALLLMLLLLACVGTAYAVIQVSKPVSATLTVLPNDMPEINGDVDANGKVELYDLALVASNFNLSPPRYPLADINLDGIVDIFDIVWVGINFGSS